jgi:hypothetical protein
MFRTCPRKGEQEAQPAIHFGGGILPNEADTSGHGLPVTSFLWVSQTNLETFGHRARYFAGFTHLKTSQLPSNGGSNFGPLVIAFCKDTPVYLRILGIHLDWLAQPVPFSIWRCKVDFLFEGLHSTRQYFRLYLKHATVNHFRFHA